MQTRVACISLTLLGFVACSDERPLSSYVGTPPGAGSGSGAGSTSSAGGSSATGAGGAGGANPLTELPEEPACQRNVAFQAHGINFVEPTPQALALRLNEMSFGYDSQGIVVALGAAQAGSPKLLAGFAEAQGGVHQITAGDPIEARVGPGGFESLGVQSSALLRVGHGAHIVDLELRNVSVRARTVGECGEAWVSLSAVIPTSEGSQMLKGEAGLDSVADLAGGSQDGQVGWQFQALFLTEAVSFDFESWTP